MKMKTSALLLDFSVDKVNNRINVEREFAAPVSKVWAAWTEGQLLDQWWAPKPWKARTKALNFRVGGHWLYAMNGPAGEESWCRADYTSISPLKSFSGEDAFCDAAGNINNDFPVAYWTVEFKEKGNSTFVKVEIRFNRLADVEKYIEMGFREGFLAALENLDTLLDSAEIK
jgi:uncharacterized protein YndB with AHSA1/START domain